MWNCKHCKKEFDFKTTSEKGNHSKWCDENPKRNETLKRVQLNARKNADEKFGKMEEFDVECHECGKSFKVEERVKIFPKKERYFCTRVCSNSVGGKARADNIESSGEMKYRSVAERHHEQECVVCGFDKIVEAHHINEIHEDNRRENLVFLCPNHHRMFHSRFRKEIEPYIQKIC